MTALYPLLARYLFNPDQPTDRPDPRRTGLDLAMDQLLLDILFREHPALDLAACHDDTPEADFPEAAQPQSSPLPG